VASQFRILIGSDGSPSANAALAVAAATSGAARLLLGSVAMGALDRSPIPVLIVP
jgi:nucleotide-binding universal stress UspA family protein